MFWALKEEMEVRDVNVEYSDSVRESLCWADDVSLGG